MRGLLAVSALFALPVIPLSSPFTPPEACFVAAIAVVVDDVKDPKEIMYHRMVVAGIRKLDPAPHALAESCDPRDPVVPMLLRQAAESRLHGVKLEASQVRHTYAIRQASLEATRSEVKRFAMVARRYSGSFTRVETVLTRIRAER